MEGRDVARFNGLLGVGLIEDDKKFRAAPHARRQIHETIAA
jgi:hypothetical protein